MHKEFAKAVFTDNYTKIGMANQEPKATLHSGVYRWIAFETNLLGCPAYDLNPITCSTHADCDDGVYCNGVETCNGGVCQEVDPVVCDNGLFCDGQEECVEGDGCVSSGDPCGPGTTCNEDTDTCDPDYDCPNGTCEAGENCKTCPDDCPSGPQGEGDCADCFKGGCDGVCHPKKDGQNCPDCEVSWCCGDGVCEGEETGYNCEIDCGPAPGCGDGSCEQGEECNCPDDCGAPPGAEDSEEFCSDGIDNDCDEKVDCDDADCTVSQACSCLPKSSECSLDGECCSGKCRGGKCR